MLSTVLYPFSVLAVVLALLVPVHQSAATVAGGQSIGDPFAPELGNTGYDVTHYDLALKFDLDQGTLSGVATIQAKATLDQLGSLSLDFSTLQASAVNIDDQSAQFDQHADTQKLLITLPRPLSNGTSFKIAVTYSGKPQPFTSRYVPFLPIGLYVDTAKHRAFAVDEPNGAHTWFPCNDHPRDRASYTFHITVGAGLTAVANGQQQGDPVKNADGTRTFNWNMPQDMASYLAVVAVADYVAKPLPGQSLVPVTVYAYSADADLAVQAFADTASLLQFETEKFGPFPFESYGQVTVAQQEAALETQSMTIMPDGLIHQPHQQNLEVIAHEMSHQWFGDSVALSSWAEIWLNEGFASYAEYLVVENFDGKQRADQVLDAWEKALPHSVDQAPVAAPTVQGMFGNNSYLKGGFILHMLRQEMGDAAFFKTLQTYAARFRNRSATTDDFRAVAEEVSGKSLGSFFDQWLRRAGMPRLDIFWMEQNGSIDALICQRAGQPFTLTLPLTLDGDPKTAANKTDSESISISSAETHAHFAPGFDVLQWEIDRDQHVLAQATAKQVDALPASCAQN